MPVHRDELTRFPHAVVEVKLSLPAGTVAPQWVDVLLNSGYLSEVGGLQTVLVWLLLLVEVVAKSCCWSQSGGSTFSWARVTSARGGSSSRLCCCWVKFVLQGLAV